jgi:HSP20 family protein
LEGFGDEFGRLPDWWGDGRLMPPIDMAEDEGSVTLTAELPGISRENLEVTIEDGVLTVQGEKKEEETAEGASYRRVERRFGQFERRIRLPEHIDAEKVEASYKDGILRVRMPKTKATKPKAIPIKTD